MEIINKIYFSIFIFSLIVLVDIIVKFKRPLILKFYLLLLTLSAGTNALIFTLELDTSVFVLLGALCKGFITFSFINIFTILYFPKLQKWVNGLGILLLIYDLFLFQYVMSNAVLIDAIPKKALLILLRTKLDFPLFLNIYRVLISLAFLGVMIYTSSSLAIKHEYQNIYFDKIKTWSKLFVSFALFTTILFIPLAFIKFPEIIGSIVSIIGFLLPIIFVFYRPSFLNRSSLKISFGDSFNRDSEYAISELEFINEFYTKLYFAQNDASLENLAKVLNISSNDLYKFIYYKYSMTFNDLVNKNRVDYFIDIIHNPKYLNFTIDALAKEAGFSSRQHLYKPFKKFHGGNPSDIMDAIAM